MAQTAACTRSRGEISGRQHGEDGRDKFGRDEGPGQRAFTRAQSALGQRLRLAGDVDDAERRVAAYRCFRQGVAILFALRPSSRLSATSTCAPSSYSKARQYPHRRR